MPVVVQKYGGSSVANAERIRKVAERIVATKRAGNKVVVVASAMGDTTDELLDLAKAVSENPAPREMDMLLTAGERISNSLLAMAIESLGEKAKSFTGSQAGVVTTESYGKAKIIEVSPGRVEKALDEGIIALVAGFQGVSQTSKDVTTLGRGGSDTTAVALAAALKADFCEIYTDVDGVYSADPRIVSNATALEKVSYEEMLEMAAAGSKVLMLRCVEYAQRYQVPVWVKSSYSDLPGTLILGSIKDMPMEEAILTGVAHNYDEARITVMRVKNDPSVAAELFEILATAKVNVDMVVQDVSAITSGLTDITFTLPKKDMPAALQGIEAAKPNLGYEKLDISTQVGKVSLIGVGMKTNPKIIASFCQALAKAQININLMSTSEIRISVLVDEDKLAKAVQVIHAEFELGTDKIATVYAGTGR